MRRFFDIQALGNLHDQMAEFVRQREPLAFRPGVLAHDDHRDAFGGAASNVRHHSVDIRQARGHDLDAAIFQKLRQIRDRVEAEAPNFA